MKKTLRKITEKLKVDSVFAERGLETEKREAAAERLDRVLEHQQTVARLLERLEQEELNGELQAEIETFIAEFSSNTPEVQQWSGEVLDRRFEDNVCIPHARRIDHPGQRALLAEGERAINGAERRAELAERFGFRFEGFASVLSEIGFWERIGPLLEEISVEDGGVPAGEVEWSTLEYSPEHPYYHALLTALNGGSAIDYEAAFPESQELFDLLKQHKYHLSAEQIGERRGAGAIPLTVADILFVRTLEQLNAGLEEDDQRAAAEMQFRVLNDQVPNTERVQLYHDLKAFYADKPVNESVVAALDAANAELSLPEDHPGYCDDLEALREVGGKVDVIVIMNHFAHGDEANTGLEVFQQFPQAFLIPSGGQSPHRTKGPEAREHTKDTEADEFMAILWSDDYKYRYAEYPDMPERKKYPKAQLHDVLVPEDYSNDTHVGAVHTQIRLAELQKIRAREEGTTEPLGVMVVTTPHHSARALSEFVTVVPSEIADEFRVYEHTGAPAISNIGQERRSVGINNLFGEYTKRSYRIATFTE